MNQLSDVSVLLVGRAQASFELLTIWLRSEGAALHFCAWNGAYEAAVRLAPTVLVVDVLDDVRFAEELLARLRDDAATKLIPAVALLASATSSAASSVHRYNKYIVAPVHPADLVSAIVGLINTRPSRPPARVTSEAEPASSLTTFIAARARRRDMRGALELLNASSPFRFTSILRFQGERLVSVWSFDREAPDADGFPLDATVESSYCALVRTRGAEFVMPDASLEPSVATHPKRHTVLSYVGVPLLAGDASLYGSLCHYDLVPRMVSARTLERLNEAALVLRDVLGDADRDARSA